MIVNQNLSILTFLKLVMYKLENRVYYPNPRMLRAALLLRNC